MSLQEQSNIREQIAEIRRTSPKEMKAHERREKVTEAVLQDLKATGDFFRTPEAFFYFEKGEAPRLLQIDGDSVALAALILGRYGINRAETREFDHIIKGLENESYVNGREVEVRRLAHFDAESGLLYVSRFDGWVYRLDGSGMRKVPNGTDDVFFLDSPSWKPYELMREVGSEGLFENLVFSSANFADGELNADEQRWIFSVWCCSQFFGSVHPTKPLLLICGEKGGGKTLSLRKWLKLLFGSDADVTALERGKADGFVAAVCSSAVAVFDNVDEHISWLPDHLAQLATGITFRRRQYYTTNQVVEFQPQCFVALTSRTPKFVEGRDDVLDRTLALRTQRREAFLPENDQLAEIARHRNQLWTELLWKLNRIVATLNESRGERVELSCRMADFASFAVKVARAEGHEETALCILDKMDSRRADMLLSEEPISVCLQKWLENPLNRGRVLPSGELFSELSEVAASLHISWPYRNANALGQRLSHITTNLREQFDVEVGIDRHSKQNLYAFWPKGEAALGRSVERAELRTHEPAPEATAAAAGVAGGFSPYFSNNPLEEELLEMCSD